MALVNATVRLAGSGAARSRGHDSKYQDLNDFEDIFADDVFADGMHFANVYARGIFGEKQQSLTTGDARARSLRKTGLAILLVMLKSPSVNGSARGLRLLVRFIGRRVGHSHGGRN